MGNSIHYFNEEAGVRNALLPARPEGERRIAPRYKVRLETRVLMIAEQEAEGEEVGLLTLAGYTHDVSESGLALIVTGEDMAELSVLGEGYTLRLTLTLPAGPIQLTVTPVRYQCLEETEGVEFLVGAQIMDMCGRDRVRFMEFIHDLARRA